jgi:integrase
MFGRAEPEVSHEELGRLREGFRAYLQSTEAKPATVRNKVSRLNRLLDMATEQGLIPRHEGIPLPPRPKRKGPTLRRYNAIRAFDTWLRGRNVAMNEVTSETFKAYRDILKAQGSTFAEDRYYCAVNSWGELAERKLVHALKPPRWSDGSKAGYGLPMSEWPSSIAADFAEFCRAANGLAKRGEKRRKLLRRESLDDIQRELSRLLGYMVNVRGVDVSALSLADILAYHETVIGYASWNIAERCDGTERKHNGETLQWFARLLEWFDGDQEIVRSYRLTAKSLKPERSKDPFPARPITYQEFTGAALRWIEKAERDWKALGPNPKRTQEATSAAIACRDGLLFAFLVCRPLRSRNMRELQIGANLFKAGGIWELRFSEGEMKAGSYHCRFPTVLMPYLEFYLAEIRPFLAAGETTKELFLTKSGKRIGRSDFWKIMVKAGRSIMSLRTNPHLFRYLIPSAYLLQYPGRALEMQALLGHAVLETTLRYYVHVYSRVASQRSAKVLRQNCPSMVELGQLFPPIATP